MITQTQLKLNSNSTQLLTRSLVYLNANGGANIQNSTIHVNIDHVHFIKNTNSYSKANKVQNPRFDKRFTM